MKNADGHPLNAYSVGYHPTMGDDQPLLEWCCYAASSFEARVIAIQDCPVLRSYPSLIKYIVTEVRCHV